MLNYKKIIRNRNTRVQLMRFLSFIPDTEMIKLQYLIKTGNILHLRDPQRYTEKIQWYKLCYRDPLMMQCANKYEVREYVKKCGYQSILNPIFGIYNTPDEIPFRKLPNQFVMKDTLGGGGNEVIICKDKSSINIPKVKKIMDGWVQPKKGKNPGREWVYDQSRSQIIIEKYIESSTKDGGLIDYKFFCFNGKFYMAYVITNRVVGKEAELGIYDNNLKLMSVYRLDEKRPKKIVQKPNNWGEMIEIAEKLSSPFPHARIDLYNVLDQIIFGEITFFDGSGYMKFSPDEFDFILGKYFILPEIKSKNRFSNIYRKG